MERRIILGRSPYGKNRQVYLNQIIAENLKLEPGRTRLIFHPGDQPGEIIIRVEP